MIVILIKDPEYGGWEVFRASSKLQAEEILLQYEYEEVIVVEGQEWDVNKRITWKEK